MHKKTGGMADIVAGQTAICTVSATDSALCYRGYRIEDLVEYADFDELAYLLIEGHLPTVLELSQWQAERIQLQELPEQLKKYLEAFPKKAHPMDILRTACSLLGMLEPELEPSVASGKKIAKRLYALLPSILAYWYQYHHVGHEVKMGDFSSFAGHFLFGLQGQAADQDFVKMLNASCILYAEHEFNASTFAARVTCATASDFYSAICSAIGTLKGSLHGGANEAAMALFEKMQSPTQARQSILEMLRNKEKIMGFGHRVYQEGDPRSPIIQRWAYQLAKKTHQMNLYEIAEAIADVVMNEKGLYPNVDFYSAVAYHCAGIESALFTPIFVLARITGWSAHILEQRANNRLIRPMADYVGPGPQAFIQIEQRG
jgi:2-methylcitrate synthase